MIKINTYTKKEDKFISNGTLDVRPFGHLYITKASGKLPPSFFEVILENFTPQQSLITDGEGLSIIMTEGNDIEIYLDFTSRRYPVNFEGDQHENISTDK